MGVYVLNRRFQQLRLFDTFTGGNGVLISGRSPGTINATATTWASITGTMRIESDRAAHTGSGEAAVACSLGASNGNLKATWYAGNTTGDDTLKMLFRRQDASNYWEVLIGRVGGASVFKLNEVIGGSATQRAFENFGYVAEAVNVVDVTFDGLDISATYNGVKLFTYGNATRYLTLTSVGFALTMTGTIAAHSALDDFQGYRF